MLTSNVESLRSPVKASIQDVAHWADEMGKRGEFSPATAGFYKTALTKLTSVLGPDEPVDPTSILANIEDIGARFGRIHTPKPGTLRTYVSRARTVLGGFIEYSRDPAKFRSRKPVTAKGRKASRKSKASEHRAERARQAPAGPVAAPSEPTDLAWRSFPLADGREIRFALPRDLRKEEIARFGIHLATLQPDFDPTELVRFVQHDQ